MPKRNLNKIYRWHSINLIPHASSVTVVEDNPPYKPIGRLFELTLFGIVVHVILPIKVEWKVWRTKIRGPRWSRRQHKWKWGQEL